MKMIFWDWNGTLINDTPVNVDIFNRVREHYGHAPVSVERYREIYQHPIRGMYEQSGFDFAKDSYEDIAERWIQIYHTYPNPPKLHDDTVPVLEAFQEKGARQAILSALPHAALEKAVAHHGIDHFFEAVRGAVDVFGHGKVFEGVQLARHVELAGADITIVGDSTHDAEVAQELGARCYLVSLGAESERRLLETGFPVCGSLSDVYRQVHGHTPPTIP